MHRYLITGGAGFIGSALARALLARGDRVRIIDDFSSGRRQNLADIATRVEIIDGNILNPALLEQAMAGVKVVFHLAALPPVPTAAADPIAYHAVNATGSLNVLEAARRGGARRVVYASSAAAYGDNPVVPKMETMVPSPVSPYGASKLAGELYCQVYAAAYGVESVCLRLFNVFGPRQNHRSEHAAVIPRLITSALVGQAPVIFGDGAQSRDFCFVDNVVDAHLKAAHVPRAAGRIYNIGSGIPTTLNEVLAAIAEAIGRPLTARHEAARPGSVRHSVADIAAASATLGYSAAIDLDEGLRQTIAWYRKSRSTSGSFISTELPNEPPQDPRPASRLML
ncbi:MAG: NAD-dependent epimerase/dehydratase family protein [Haliangium ochraceum]